jgi:hypothetical protein
MGLTSPHHEDILGRGGIAPPFLTSPLDGSEWLASCVGSCTQKGTVTGASLMGEWVGPRTSLDAGE